MWSILNDLHINREIKKFKEKKRCNTLKTNTLPKFVFVCGEQILNDDGIYKCNEELKKSKNKRHYLINELEQYENKGEGNRSAFNNVICIISEKLYKSNDLVDLLTFEKLLAELSEEIILIIESYGTACELGAFSIDNEIMKKLYIINSRTFEKAKSFINQGPITKIRNYREDKVIYFDETYNEFKNNFQLKQHLLGQKINIVDKNTQYTLSCQNKTYSIL